MNNIDFNTFKKWFYTYTDSFLTSDPDFNYHIILKREHCRRVSKEIVELGKSLRLSSEKLIRAELIGLFHDLGRFEQYSTYKTFSDEKSRDHAELGKEVVMDKTLFDDLDNKEKNIILSSISFHNKLSISSDLKGEERFFIKLLRDADKIDIWKVLIEHYLSENKNNNTVLLDLPDNPSISDKVIMAVNNKQLVRKEHIESVNDFKILNMSWVFDLNFSYTYQEVIKRKYIDTLKNLLPDNDSVRKVYDIVYFYLERNI